MFKPNRITSIEYYRAQKAIAQEDAKAAPATNYGRAAYYTDNGAGESAGVWWTREKPQTNSFPSLLPSSPFGLDESEVEDGHLNDLALGRDPITKESFSKKKDRSDKRTIGFDVTFPAPKSVSVRAAAASEEERGRLFAAHDRAVRRAMAHAFDSGLMVTKESKVDQTTGKRIYYGEEVQGASAAVYRHFTARSDDGEILPDPQLHSHVVIMNSVRYADGRIGAMNDSLINAYNGTLGVIYRSELASILREEHGLECVVKGRNFEIAGVPDEIGRHFSKRRQTIEKLAKEGGFDTAKDRRAAEIAALASRAAKDKSVSLTELEAAWTVQLGELGWTPEALVESTAAAARTIRREQEADTEPRDEKIRRLAREAVETMTRHDAVVEHRIVERTVLEALQTTCNADEALAAVEYLQSTGLLVEIGQRGQQPVFTTQRLLETERKMLRAAVDLKGVRQFVPAAAIERAIAGSTLRDDQAVSVRHALNNDGISIVEGSAGAGKSFSLGVVTRVLHAEGYRVLATAPSWKATTGLQQDIGLPDDCAMAIQGMVRKIAAGKFSLDRHTTVIVDEAGMVSLDDMAVLVEECRRSGAKLILSGDTRQLQPVAAGSPMTALARYLGSSRMTEIVRQKAEWMQAATKDFADLSGGDALAAYDKAGGLVMADTRDEAIDALVSDYVESRGRPDGERPTTRAVLTGRNADVRTINDRIRQAGREAGWIGERDWSMTVIPRGETEARELTFAQGDDIIFGETVELSGVTLRNADLGRIESIAGDENDPTLRIKLAKGPTIETRLSQLVGSRSEIAEGEDAVAEPAVPKMQHAAAMTVHASQGVTVDEAFVANIHGMGAQSGYVAMSRHRSSVRMYVDAGRLADTIGLGGHVLKIGSAEGGAPESDKDRERLEITPGDLKKALFTEIERADRKENPSDYFEHRDFLMTPAEKQNAAAERAAKIEAAAPKVAPSQTQIVRDALTAGRRLSPPISMSVPVGAGAALAERMATRETKATAYPTPKATGRITAEEFAAFRKLDLRAFVQERGMVADGDPRTGPSGQTFQKMRDPSQGDRRLTLTRHASGDWSFSSEDGKARGDITKLLAWQTGRPSIKCAHDLRGRLAGETPETVADRPAGTARDPRPIVDPTPKGRVTDEERNQMVRTDLLQFAVDNLGGKLVERWGGGGAVRFGGDNGEKVGITEKGGIWNWTVSNDTGRSGVIWDLVQHVRGMQYGPALHWLRDQLNTWRPDPQALRVERDTRPAKERPTPEAVRAGFAKFPPGVSRWLTEERGIRRDVIERFRADVKADWTGDRASNRHGAVFAHRTPEGEIVSYVRRGAPRDGEDQSFRQNAAGGSPTLFMAGDRKPERVIVTESAIDTLSLYQADQMPAGAMLLAPDGTPGRRSLDALTEIARRNPDAEWHVGLDNDAKGGEFAAQVRAAVQAGNPNATFRDRAPAAEFKDWNAAIRGVTAEQEKAAKIERQQRAEIEAQRIEEEKKAEEARQRREREAALAANRPAGPRFR